MITVQQVAFIGTAVELGLGDPQFEMHVPEYYPESSLALRALREAIGSLQTWQLHQSSWYHDAAKFVAAYERGAESAKALAEGAYDNQRFGRG